MNEHGAIVEALRARDTARAIAVPCEHFNHVESRLRLDEAVGTVTDLRAVFSLPVRRRVVASPKRSVRRAATPSRSDLTEAS